MRFTRCPNLDPYDGQTAVYRAVNGATTEAYLRVGPDGDPVVWNEVNEYPRGTSLAAEQVLRAWAAHLWKEYVTDDREGLQLDFRRMP